MQLDTDPKYQKQLRAALISGDPRNLIRLAQNTGRTKLFTTDVQKAEAIMHKLRATLPDMPPEVRQISQIWLAAHNLNPRISDRAFGQLKGPKF